MGQTKRSEERQARIDEAHELLLGEIGKLTSSGSWTAWLQAMAKFPSYSPTNSLMVMAQLGERHGPVAGYRTWQKLGRQVQRGANGIAIWAPCLRRIEVDQADEGAATSLRALGGFRIVHVFAASDTEGSPLPESPARPTLLEGEAPEGMWEYLVRRVVNAGFGLSFVSEIPGTPLANGMTHFDGLRRVVIATDGRSEASQTRTLAHELAHVLLHGARNTPRSIAEVEAESVAFLVADAFGLDGMAYSLGYVASWGSEASPNEVLATASRIRDCAREILSGLEPAPEATE